MRENRERPHYEGPLGALNLPRPDLRYDAINEISNSPEAERHVDLYIEALKQSHTIVRLAGCNALNRLDAKLITPEVVSSIAEMVVSETQSSVRNAAIVVLKRAVGTPLPQPLLKRMLSADQPLGLRAIGMSLLRGMTPQPDGASELYQDVIVTGSETLIAEALLGVASIGPQASSLAPLFNYFITTGRHAVRSAAVEAVIGTGASSPDLADSLMSLIALTDRHLDRSLPLGVMALKALASGPKACLPFVGVFRHLLRGEASKAWFAAEIIGRLGKDAAAAEADLINAATHARPCTVPMDAKEAAIKKASDTSAKDTTEDDVSVAAMWAITKVCPESEAAAEAVKSQLAAILPKTIESHARLAALSAKEPRLKRIFDEGLDRKAQASFCALISIGHLKDALEYVPFFSTKEPADVLKSETHSDTISVLAALTRDVTRRFPFPAERSAADLKAMLQSESPTVRHTAVLLLGRFGGLGRDVSDSIYSLDSNADELGKTVIAETAGRIGKTNPEKACSLLSRLLVSDALQVRIEAAKSLSILCVATDETKAALTLALVSEDEALAKAARKALDACRVVEKE